MREQLSSELRKAVGEKVGVVGAISDPESLPSLHTEEMVYVIE